MANPPSTQATDRPRQQATARRTQAAVAGPASANFCKMIIIFLIALIVLVGLAVLIAWLIVHPKKLVYTVENASAQNFVIKNDHLNAKFNFVVAARNPNRRMSLYYDHIDLSVGSDGQKVAYTTLTPFYQHRRNTTTLEATLYSRDVALSQDLSRDLKTANASGEAKLNVWIKAKIRYKVGAIKLSHQTLKVFCPSVIVPISSSKNFQRVYCDVDD